MTGVRLEGIRSSKVWKVYFDQEYTGIILTFDITAKTEQRLRLHFAFPSLGNESVSKIVSGKVIALNLLICLGNLSNPTESKMFGIYKLSTLLARHFIPTNTKYHIKVNTLLLNLIFEL